jgi:hypothetical protein
VPDLDKDSEPSIAELARKLQAVQDALKQSDGEIAIAKAEARAARKSAEVTSLQNQLHIVEVEADAATARKTVFALKAQLEAVDTHRATVPSFQNKGNEIQFHYNKNVVNDLTIALTALELGNVEDVDKYVRRSIAALKLRNKCIRIAETSPFGWATVEEYLGSEVASDDEDDKKLRRAESSAELKIKRKDPSYRGRGRGAPSQRGRQNIPGNGQYNNAEGVESFDHNNYQNTAQGNYNNGAQGAYNQAQGTYNHPNSANNNAANGPKPAYYKPGPCYYCQGPHLRIHCTKLAEDTAKAQAKIEADFAAQK